MRACSLVWPLAAAGVLAPPTRGAARGPAGPPGAPRGPAGSCQTARHAADDGPEPLDRPGTGPSAWGTSSATRTLGARATARPARRRARLGPQATRDPSPLARDATPRGHARPGAGAGHGR
jgi:hypothetical protein